MRNFGPWDSAELPSPLRNPDSFQHQNFNITLKWVGALVDFSLKTQYRSHTPDLLACMEMYLQTFHQKKNIFLEFHTSKSTHVEENRQDRELSILIANQITQEAHHIPAGQCRWRADQNRLKRVNWQADLIQ